MSDGPHKSLPMRRAWKALAKRADQSTYEAADVAEALPKAVASDWANEVSAPLITAIKNVFAGKNNSLRLKEIALDQLEAAKPLAAGSKFGASALAWANQLVREGRTDSEALYEAVGLAAKERVFDGFRTVEEHYLRESTARRADGVRARLEEAASVQSSRDLGAFILEPRTRPSAPNKRVSLDEGVPL